MREHQVIVHGIYTREVADALAKQLEEGMPSSMFVSIEEVNHDHSIEADDADTV